MDTNLTNLGISSRKIEGSHSSCSFYRIYLYLIALWILYFESIGLSIEKIIKSYKDCQIFSQLSSLTKTMNLRNILNEKP